MSRISPIQIHSRSQIPVGSCASSLHIGLTLLADDALRKFKAQISAEDSKKRNAGLTFAHATSPSEFLQQALEIEELQ